MTGKSVIVITGPSGAGKGTLIQKLLARFPELELAVSATTRERRRGEEDGREYWFLAHADFEERVQAGDFLEHVRFTDHRYGTLRSELTRIADGGRIPVLELEIDGALTIRDSVPESVTVFVSAPLEALEARLRERATESAGEISDRLEVARRQLLRAGEFDHVVVNDDVDRAAAELTSLVGSLAGAATMSGR